MRADLTHLKTVEQRLLWLSHWMIHHANHVRPKVDGIKVGGHQASSASMVSIMTALYFRRCRPEDRVAVKPHASPVFHAMQYLMGNQTARGWKTFRGSAGCRAIPAARRTSTMWISRPGRSGWAWRSPRLRRSFRTTSGAKGWGKDAPMGRMVALVGDAELDEGNIYEALQEGWKNDLRNTWWIIDYNRQSLDGIVREGLFGRIEKVFRCLRLGRRSPQTRRACNGRRLKNPAERNCATGSMPAPIRSIPR